MGSERLLCICDEEWCYCTNRIILDDFDPRAGLYPPPEIACEDCKAGRHVMEPK